MRIFTFLLLMGCSTISFGQTYNFNTYKFVKESENKKFEHLDYPTTLSIKGKDVVFKGLQKGNEFIMEGTIVSTKVYVKQGMQYTNYEVNYTHYGPDAFFGFQIAQAVEDPSFRIFAIFNGDGSMMIYYNTKQF